VGEVGLGGEVRAVSHVARRIGEAAKRGFRRVLLPRANRAGLEDETSGVELTAVESVAEALDLVLTSE
jgi:DNA repair protein RadA/Sms